MSAAKFSVHLLFFTSRKKKHHLIHIRSKASSSPQIFLKSIQGHWRLITTLCPHETIQTIGSQCYVHITISERLKFQFNPEYLRKQIKGKENHEPENNR